VPSQQHHEANHLPRDFDQIEWDEAAADDCRQIVRLAIREDLEREQDWTTLALVPPDRTGSARIVARSAGVVAGMPALRIAVEELRAHLSLQDEAIDGTHVAAGAILSRVSGSVRDLLTSERILLNLLGRLKGVATLTDRYVQQVAGTAARIYDTRKTTPGWRRLEKYAVRCGGGHNHRAGLYDAVLIKDNHLAQSAAPGRSRAETAAAAVRQARQFLREVPGERSLAGLIVEVEVDDLDQLAGVLPERPDVVLLDNMSLDQLRVAVAMRNEFAGGVELEASGGVTLETVRGIAETGVERISVGALTHSAPALDVSMEYDVG
jgi:nicotinate-nucleotide pyrophosphorylase (carboxylating)